MKIFKRLKAARSALFQKDESAVAMIDPDVKQRGWLGQSLHPHNYETVASETYLTNSTVFSCISRIAHGVGSIPWEVVKRTSKGWKQLPKHPLAPIIGYAPNPTQTASEFYFALTATLMIGGKVYIEKVAPTSGPNTGIPKELYVHRPDRVEQQRDDSSGRLIAYVYTGIDGKKKSFPVDPITLQSDMREIKLFNPLNEKVMGSPAAAALYREIDTLNTSIDWNKALLENSAKTGFTAIVQGNVLTQDAADKLQKRFDSQADVRNTGKSRIIPIGGSFAGEEAKVEIIKDTWSPKELDHLQGQWDLRKVTCMGLGVPPQILGIPGESKFANYSEAVKWFWETTVLGTYARLFRDVYNRWLFPVDSNEEIRYNIDNLPAFAEKRAVHWERIRTAEFLTLNEKRKELGFEPLGPEGDVMLAQAGLLPLSIVAGDDDTFDNEAEEALRSIELPKEEIEKYLEELGQYG